MASPGQKRGGCGHLMAGFDTHSFCARCHDKGKGQDPCVEKTDSVGKFCNILTSDQRPQFSTPSYKLKKEKREAKSTSTPSKEAESVTLGPTLVDPSHVSVVGVMDGQGTVRSPAEKKKKVEDKKSKSVKSDKPTKSSSTSSSRQTSASNSLTS